MTVIDINTKEDRETEFVKEYVSIMLIDEHLVYQKRPSFRVSLTDNKAVGELNKEILKIVAPYHKAKQKFEKDADSAFKVKEKIF